MKSEPWIGKTWHGSPYNFASEVISKFKLSDKIEIYDVTLRDGEQFPGVVFNLEDKIKIAQTLDEAGVHSIEAGMPAVSDEDFRAVKEISNLGLKTKVKSFSRARKEDIDLALKADVWGITLELPSSKHLIETGYRWSEEKVIDMAVEAAIYAKSHGLHTTFFNIDSTRSDRNYLKKLVTTVVEQAKVDAIAVVDTFGVISPWGLVHLINEFRSWVDIPLEVHCHNDMGLATVNSLAALTAGAQIIHTNINGIGERSGGAALEEIVVGMKFLFNLEIGIDLSVLRKLSKIVEVASAVKMPPHKPVVGDQSFAYEAGIAVMFAERFKEENYLQGAFPYLPSMVSNEYKIILGKKSGRHSINTALKKIGLTFSSEESTELLNSVKNLSIKNKRGLKQSEFETLAKEVLKQK